MTTSIFNKYEKQFVKAILTHISNMYEIELGKMLSDFNISHEDPLDKMMKYVENENEKRCKAIIDGNKRCSRKCKENNLCLTHFKMFSRNKSSITFENKSEIDFDFIVLKMRTVRKIPGLIASKLIFIDKKEYILDESTNNVFDFDSYKFIGKLDMFNLIKTEI